LAGWLAGNADISELERERERDFGFVVVDSVGHGQWTIQKFLDQALLWVPELWRSKILG
jgi:hypothetical protein